ncbi:hypothetical protein, variant [Verruconis gallopava]|uniref:Rhodopsin domain-containing protein n=1 Tax=Verruconis gallopava TaxID=253628 RepID=A0A0D2B2Q2_9PEZI|nr:uncharacterized protein PV09_03423 [Verruconis gallopava]XP_016215414.1 hypothetical protein, variant [Verruconis gallopava]KIW05544.1 hypothetical protein PV09_03423 [Verruconis gallopava]KIW05545.1 hypothetical protein, variant [Verruconis gallopava]
MPGGPHVPLEVAMSWKSNYVNPPTHGSGIVVEESILLGLCYLTVALRVYTRGFLAKNFGLDDLLIIMNLIPLTGFAAILILAFTKYGWDKHIWDIPPDQLVQARKAMFAMEIIYLWSSSTTRISILLFYRRLGGSVSQVFRYTVYAAIASVMIYNIGYNIFAFTQCTPLNAYWNMGNAFWLLAHQGDWKCADEAAAVVTAAAISMVQDFLVCILPMALFWHLKISFKQKLALTGIFGVGFFLCICGILRMIYIIKIYFYTYDMTWVSLQIWIWSGIESHVAIIVASLPALNHFFGYVKAGKVVSGLKYGTSRTGGSSRKGYDQTTSQTNSQIGYESKTAEAYDRAIHVTHDVRLEEFVNDKRYDLYNPSDFDDQPWTNSSRFDDVETTAERTPEQTSTTWLEDDTSGEESAPEKPGPERKYSGFADSRRFY